MYPVHHFAPKLDRRIKFVAKRYDLLPTKATAGVLVQGLLLKRELTAKQAALVLIYLVRNLYALGPRICNVFFMDACQGDPNLSEKALQRKRDIVDTARDLLYVSEVTVHDVIAGHPVRLNNYEFEKNMDRVNLHAEWTRG